MNQPFNKWVNKLGRQFSKEERQMANKLFENCSNPLPSWKWQNCFEVPAHSTENGAIKRKKDNKNWRGCGKKNPLHTVDW